jgi:hypothetical protein
MRVLLVRLRALRAFLTDEFVSYKGRTANWAQQLSWPTKEEPFGDVHYVLVLQNQKKKRLKTIFVL